MTIETTLLQNCAPVFSPAIMKQNHNSVYALMTSFYWVVQDHMYCNLQYSLEKDQENIVAPNFT